MGKKILAIRGSARRGGNSDTILDAALEVWRAAACRVETLVARELDITPCLSCGGCWNTGRCVVGDAMQDLYPKFMDCDHIVVASPVYFTSLPGHLKVLIDRFQPYWVRAFRLDGAPKRRRTGMFLCIGAMDRDKFFQASRTIVASWMITLNMKCAVARFFTGLDARDDIDGRPDYLEQARAVARELLGQG
jgi:multimeric flavodoxin WrbA